MKPHHWYAAAIFVVALLVTTVASAQEHRQFDEQDRQVTRDWYNQHQTNPPRGLRNQDRLSAREEAQLERGKPLASHLLKKSYTPPRDLRRHLPPPPRHHRYVVIGHHVVLIDDNHVALDVIHLH
jgi:Ni/Co efflux regulator RcnB